jgi:hypothetical protein
MNIFCALKKKGLAQPATLTFLVHFIERCDYNQSFGRGLPNYGFELLLYKTTTLSFLYFLLYFTSKKEVACYHLDNQYGA